jgi:hypothetical protein
LVNRVKVLVQSSGDLQHQLNLAHLEKVKSPVDQPHVIPCDHGERQSTAFQSLETSAASLENEVAALRSSVKQQNRIIEEQAVKIELLEQRESGVVIPETGIET